MQVGIGAVRFLLEKIQEAFQVDICLMEARHILEGSTDEIELWGFIELQIASIRYPRRILDQRFFKRVLELGNSSHLLLGNVNRVVRSCQAPA